MIATLVSMASMAAHTLCVAAGAALERSQHRRAPHRRMVIRVGPAQRRVVWPSWLCEVPVVGPMLWRRIVRRGFSVRIEP